MIERRMKILSLPEQILSDFLRHMFNEVEGDEIVPEDTRICDLKWNWKHGELDILVQHDTFEPLPIGGTPKRHSMERIDK